MMAIAEIEASEWEMMYTRASHLRLLDAPVEAPRYRTGLSISERRQRRERKQALLRRTMLIVGSVSILALLVWPSVAFGGTSVTGLSGDSAATGNLSSGVSYTVQSGDTMASIARLINPNDPAGVQRVLEQEVGSDVVLPGEHIIVP